METQDKTGSLIASWTGHARTLVERWGAVTTIGTFLLYLFGYLSLRFHLSAIGLATDLAAFDERYLFAGARFLVNLLAASPFALALFLSIRKLAVLTRFLDRLNPSKRTTLSLWFCIGALAVLFLPAAQLLPISGSAGRWSAIVAGQGVERWAVFVVQLTIWMCALAAWTSCAGTVPDSAWQMARLGMIAAMLALMTLSLPVNYGTVVERYVAYPSCQCAGERGWLIWEGRTSVHYIVQRPEGRVFLTVPAGEVKRYELRGAVNLLPLLPESAEPVSSNWGFCVPEGVRAVASQEVPKAGPEAPAARPAGTQPITLSGILQSLGFGPVNVQGESTKSIPGDIWEVRKGSPPKKLAAGMYMWPVAQPGSGAVFALLDDKVVQPGSQSALAVPGALRLMAFLPQSPAELCVWLRNGQVRVVNVRTGAQYRPAGDPPDWLPSTMAEHLVNVAGRIIEPQKRTPSGSDIFDGDDRIADCEGDECGQISRDAGGRILYIRARRKPE